MDEGKSILVPNVYPLSYWVNQYKQTMPDSDDARYNLGCGVRKGIIYHDFLRIPPTGKIDSRKNTARETVCISCASNESAILYPDGYKFGELQSYFYIKMAEVFGNVSLWGRQTLKDIGSIVEDAIDKPEVRGLYKKQGWVGCLIDLRNFESIDGYGRREPAYALKTILSSEASALDFAIYTAKMRRR